MPGRASAYAMGCGLGGVEGYVGWVTHPPASPGATFGLAYGTDDTKEHAPMRRTLARYQGRWDSRQAQRHHQDYVRQNR
jgi:hypothetical protein